MSTEARANLNIVLIEDDLALCQGWTDLFELLGHKIQCYQNGTALFEDPALETYELLITDFYLPDMNGAELVQRMRERFAKLPAIVLTGSRETFIREAVEKIDNCQILYKPLNIEDLEVQLAKLFPA